MVGSSPRRQLMRHIVSWGFVILAGCTTRSDPIPPSQEQTPERSDEVPERLERCTDLAGNRRDPTDLVSKDESGYRFSPEGAEQCSNCRFFCEDPAGGFIGACSIVEGEVRTSDWCELYEPVDRLDGTPTVAGTH